MRWRDVRYVANSKVLFLKDSVIRRATSVGIRYRGERQLHPIPTISLLSPLTQHCYVRNPSPSKRASNVFLPCRSALKLEILESFPSVAYMSHKRCPCPSGCTHGASPLCRWNRATSLVSMLRKNSAMLIWSRTRPYMSYSPMSIVPQS